MNARELMIGDLVQVNKKGICIAEGTLVKVIAIDSTNELSALNLTGCATCVDIKDRQNIGGIWLEYLEPIPLTREILEKNGFDCSDGEVVRYNFTDGDYNGHFSLRAMYDKEDNQKGWSFYAFNVLTIIDYVHELQHALKLCGIEMDIEI